jgi:hypothetical protein
MYASSSESDGYEDAVQGAGVGAAVRAAVMAKRWQERAVPEAGFRDAQEFGVGAPPLAMQGKLLLQGALQQTTGLQQAVLAKRVAKKWDERTVVLSGERRKQQRADARAQDQRDATGRLGSGSESGEEEGPAQAEGWFSATSRSWFGSSTKVPCPADAFDEPIVIGDMGRVQELCRAVDINGVNSGGLTALHTAVISKNKEIVRWLLQNGADVQHRTKEMGWTVLHSACARCVLMH